MTQSKNIMQTFKIVLYIIVALYIILLVVCAFIQTKLIFYPSKLTRNFQFEKSYTFDEVFLKTSDNETINGLHFKTKSDKVILYFHGNAGSLESWQYIYHDLNFLEYNLLVIDFRGYGKSTGKISEKGLYIDGQTAYDYLVKAGFKQENIIIYGRSIGCGIAVDVASHNKSKALILEAPFSSFNKLANHMVPFLFPSLFLNYSFDNLGKINKVNTPLLIIHGKKDGIIPFKLGEALYNEYKGHKEFLAIENGTHNDLPSFAEYHNALGIFIEKLAR